MIQQEGRANTDVATSRQKRTMWLLKSRFSKAPTNLGTEYIYISRLMCLCGALYVAFDRRAISCICTALHWLPDPLWQTLIDRGFLDQRGSG